MRILILGGTWFFGRILAQQALDRGWQVTAFSRGRSGSPPEGVVHVAGDRVETADLTRLAQHGPWGAVVDTSAYEPADVNRAVAVLDGAAGRYVLISTVSAYRDWPGSPVDETSPTWPSRLDAAEADPDIAALDPRWQYGILKSGCEMAADSAPGGRLILRPGVILGPGEYVGRTGWLLHRARLGGRWLLPGPPEQPIQPVDVRDLAAFTLDRIAAGDGAVYNVTAPAGFATYGDLIGACIAATGDRAEPVWVDPAWLTSQGVRQWTEIPLWRADPGTWRVDGRRAQAAGLACRSLAETITDWLTEYDRRPPVPHPRQAEHGMDPAREAQLLAAWDARVLAGG